jgi:holo-[acyl-carrier protein] synthase
MGPLFSVGTDIVEVSRIRTLARDKRFLEKIFTADEIAYCRAKKNSAQHFAVRFAAKEAVWKALSGLNFKGIGHREIGVQRTALGQPRVFLSGRLKKFEKRIALSLSHTDKYAVAVALFEKK